MGRKIFVSYKHSDAGVRPLEDTGIYTVRDYVDILEDYIQNDNIYKGERNNEDLSNFSDELIESHLRDKIFDSSVTLVLISKNMRDLQKREDDQWIPWEIAYSLKETTRGNRTSNTNAMLAIVIPDEDGSYDYFVESNSCTTCYSNKWKTDNLFSILGRNMFNRKEARTARCLDGACNKTMHLGQDHSYIYPVKWDDFMLDVEGYISMVVDISENINDYKITKTI